MSAVRRAISCLHASASGWLPSLLHEAESGTPHRIILLAKAFELPSNTFPTRARFTIVQRMKKQNKIHPENNVMERHDEPKVERKHVIIKPPCDAGKVFTHTVDGKSLRFIAPGGRHAGHEHEFSWVVGEEQRFVDIKLPVAGGKAFKWTVDGVERKFTAPQGMDKGALHKFSYMLEIETPKIIGENPPGTPPGGTWDMKSYQGDTTQVCCMLTCGLALLCPCDERLVYTAPGGSKWLQSGITVSAWERERERDRQAGYTAARDAGLFE